MSYRHYTTAYRIRQGKGKNAMGGKPSKGTPKDKRLKANKGQGPTASNINPPSPMPKPGCKQS